MDEARWTVRVDPLPDDRRRSWESIMTVSDGRIGSRGLGEAGSSPSRPATFGSGIYRSADPPDQLHGPLWTGVRTNPASGWHETACLDLRYGIVTMHLRHDATDRNVEIRRFASATDDGVAVQIVDADRSAIAVTAPLVDPDCDRDVVEHVRYGPVHVMSVSDAATGASVVAAAHDDVTDSDTSRRIDRVAAFATGAHAAVDLARNRLDAARRCGVHGLETRHRRRWDERWSTCGTDISGDVALDRAVRFATFQLLACAPNDGTADNAVEPGEKGAEQDAELAIGARGLTGTAYRGHVFWDTDVFVLPVLSAIAPHAAELALRYRRHRLGAACEIAQREGRSGARFPWESAATGEEVTPTTAVDLRGRRIPIRTGELEVHIVADVAWAVWNHHRWTGDADFLRRTGLPILVETARYWATRLEVDDDGSAHIRRVIGPDEYHEDVDDNVFTNVMAQHNLRIAADLARAGGVIDVDEARRWQALADAVVDGFDPATGLYEQFDGFHTLAPTLVAEVGTPPMSADVLLGREVIERLQISKQPDVLMAYHLVPDAMRADAFATNLDHYLARTASGSSLAPAICASLLARAGREDQALHWFELAAFLDLDDITGTTPGGLHVATMGGLWQAVTFGFLGLGVTATGLVLDPRVPDRWGDVRHRFTFRGAPVSVEIDGAHGRVESAGDLALEVGGEVRVARRHHLIRRTEEWHHR